MGNLNPQIVEGLINTYQQSEPEALNGLNISEEDMDIVRGPYIWTADKRPRAKRTMENLINGAIELAGLPSFTVPAEYTAAMIYMYVHPTNWQIASHVMQVTQTAADDIDRPDASVVRPEKLFALVCQCAAKNRTYDDAMKKKVAKNVDKAGAKEEVAPKS